MMETNRIGGRPRDSFADRHVVTVTDNEGKDTAKKCIYCPHQFSIKTSATRIKAHLAGARGQGVAPCKHVPPNISEAARNAMPSSCSNARSDANTPSNNDTQRPPRQECCTSCPSLQTMPSTQEQWSRSLDGSSQHSDVDPVCLDIQLNPPETDSVILEGLESQENLLNLSQDGMQQLPPPRCCTSGSIPPQHRTNIDHWGGQSDPFKTRMPEGFEFHENIQSYHTDFLSHTGPVNTQQCFMNDESSLPQETLTLQELHDVLLHTPLSNESCSRNGMFVAQQPIQQHPEEDPNCLPYQGVLQDAAGLDTTHDATTSQDCLQERGVCPNILPHSTHQEEMPLTEFDDHEGLELRHIMQENLQRDRRISSLDHGLNPSIVPQLHHDHIDPYPKSLNGPACTSHQKNHVKKRKLPDKGPDGRKIPLATLFQGQTFNKKVDEIHASLQDNSVSRIGVYGIGGSGKTTIVKYIYNQLLEDYSMPFSHIIWITVSQDYAITKLQRHLASRFNVILPQDEDEVARAATLYEGMQNMCYALILDDVWDKIDLERVGIPEPSCNNGCKLILTARSRDVCRRMQCKPIYLDLLLEEEAWDLFVKTVVVSPENSCVEGIMKEVAKECACLPLAIVTVAGSMRGINDVHEWRNVLDSLRNYMFDNTDMEKEVIEKLKFSYYRLSKQLQECLLACALYPEDHKINKTELIFLLISDGIIDGTESILSAYDHGCTILNKLVNVCLLMEGIYEFDEVLMHDLVRAMCLDIARSRFLVKCNSEFPPDESKYTEEVEKVSLIGSEFKEISSRMVPYCPKLSTLLLSKNWKLTRISNSFFMGFPSLKVLDLSDTSILELPKSVTNLLSLNTLVLRGCRWLKHLPCLAPLRALKELDLGESGIEEAPEGLGELINLLHLDLDKTKIRILPRLVLRNLVKLQFLYLGGIKIAMDDVKELKNLQVFVATFATLEEFNEFVSSLPITKRERSVYEVKVCCGLMSYGIARYIDGTTSFCLWGTKDEGGNIIDHNELMFAQDVEIIIPAREFVEGLDIRHFENNCHILSVLERVASSSRHMLPIRFHHGERTEESGEFKGLLDAKLLLAFSNLRFVSAINCAFMEELFSTSPSVRVFNSSLKRLKISRCDKLGRLLDPKFPSCFPNLEIITIDNCVSLESIIPAVNPTEEEESENAIKFPKLNFLAIGDLPNLRSICDGICPSIKQIHVRRCPKLKRLPLQPPVLDDNSGQLLPLRSSLKVICGERTWWESLEWDNPHAKTLLQPYFKPCLRDCYANWRCS